MQYTNIRLEDRERWRGNIRGTAQDKGEDKESNYRLPSPPPHTSGIGLSKWFWFSFTGFVNGMCIHNILIARLQCIITIVDLVFVFVTAFLFIRYAATRNH